MTILGHDIDGKPLRAGDRVVYISPLGADGCYNGEIYTVRRRFDSCRVVLSDGQASQTRNLRKLPPKQDTTTWEAIQEMTGWSPVAQPVKPC